jgi:hypothetical protein
MEPEMLGGISRALNFMFAMLAISVPLGLWKLGEIVWWVFTHIRFE